MDDYIDLNNYRKKIYSQFEEDGITQKIFNLIGTTNKVCVEFGVETGIECCSRVLWEEGGFSQILFDDTNENSKINLKKHTITVNNILEIFSKNNVPKDLDFLCVDIDSYDFYITHTILTKYSPRVLLLEVNPTFLLEDKVILLNHELNKGTYHGASLLAWYNSLKNRYDLVCHEHSGINAYFIKKGILNNLNIKNINNVEKLYKKYPKLEQYKIHPISWPLVSSDTALKILGEVL